MKTKEEINRIYRFNSELAADSDFIHIGDRKLGEDKMETEEEILWEVMAVLMQAEFVLERLAVYAKTGEDFLRYGRALRKINEVEISISPLSIRLVSIGIGLKG